MIYKNTYSLQCVFSKDIIVNCIGKATVKNMYLVRKNTLLSSKHITQHETIYEEHIKWIVEENKCKRYDKK